MIVARELEKCSRCGLCLSLCPTYAITAREQFSPRGRLALMRMIEEGGDNQSARNYLSSCLRCALCEDVCPTSVPFGSLARWFLNNAPTLVESAEIERLGGGAKLGGGDPAKAIVFELMINVWQGLRVPNELDDGAADTAGSLHGPASGGNPTLLIAGAVLSHQFSHIVDSAKHALEVAGRTVLRNRFADALSLPWLENGLLTVFERLTSRVEAELERLRIESIVVLEPSLLDVFTGALVSPLTANWRCGDQQLRPHSVFELPGVAGLELMPLVDRLPDNVAIDRTLRAADVLYQVAVRASRAPSKIMLPESLRGAGAPPVTDSRASAFLEQLIAKKLAWVRTMPDGLVTLDSYTLLRIPQASHLLDVGVNRH